MKTIVALLFLITTPSICADIFVTSYMNRNRHGVIRVMLTDNPVKADLIVMSSNYPAKDHDDIWHFVIVEEQATAVICYVKSICEADIVICFVNNYSLCGWKKHRIYRREHAR